MKKGGGVGGWVVVFEKVGGGCVVVVMWMWMWMWMEPETDELTRLTN